MTQLDIFDKVSEWMAAEGRRWDWLAGRLGISPSFLSNMKNGNDNMPDHIKSDLSKITGIDFDDRVPGKNKVHK